MDNSLGTRYDIIALMKSMVLSSYKMWSTKRWISLEVTMLWTCSIDVYGSIHQDLSLN